MFLRALFVGIGLATVVLRPTVGRTLLKQAVKAGMSLAEAGKEQTEKIKEDIQDLMAEIDLETRAQKREAELEAELPREAAPKAAPVKRRKKPTTAS